MMVVLRELLLGVNRFDEIVSNTGAARDLVSRRLNELVDAGLVEKRRYSNHADRYEYVATEAGLSLFGLLQVLRSWGDDHVRSADDRRIATYEHSCGSRLFPQVICKSCGEEVSPGSARLVDSYWASELGVGAG